MFAGDRGGDGIASLLTELVHGIGGFLVSQLIFWGIHSLS